MLIEEPFWLDQRTIVLCERTVNGIGVWRLYDEALGHKIDQIAAWRRLQSRTLIHFPGTYWPIVRFGYQPRQVSSWYLFILGWQWRSNKDLVNTHLIEREIPEEWREESMCRGILLSQRCSMAACLTPDRWYAAVSELGCLCETLEILRFLLRILRKHRVMH